MIIAIPMENDKIANHFTKASQFGFFNPEGKLIGSKLNPAGNVGCQGKGKLVRMLKEQGATHLLVRQIGQQMLGRLLTESMQVFSLANRPGELAEEVAKLASHNELSAAEQGNPSPNHKGCGCDQHKHRHTHEHVKCGCGGKDGHAKCSGSGHNKSNAGRGKGHGHGCCHGNNHDPR
ncbi:NifB/NifX family molybdenum-iron cluster-binding protein [Corallincola platygyrae]|uniref:NifB/NifX family molybdenum-iron cluster-binding protein n=1 Tax=Corallincola platygyrae TaxID=1193278 RepID=A0ABW4XK09_9GAMM